MWYWVCGCCMKPIVSISSFFCSSLLRYPILFLAFAVHRTFHMRVHALQTIPLLIAFALLHVSSGNLMVLMANTDQAKRSPP